MKTNHPKAPLIVVSGASGSGKTTLCRLVAQRLHFHYAVSHTTRPQRAGEFEAKDYYFVTKDQFDQMVKSGDFLEWAQVYDNFYGTSKKTLYDYLSKGQGVIVDVDTQGAQSIKEKVPESVTIFIQVPTLKELEKRLIDRRRDPPEVLQKRLKQATHEENQKDQYDHVIINDNLELAYSALERIIKKCL
ncbi:MAG: hypothetical protein ACD_73C00262G0002 [uncultured bacterium]|nr:MAG: hypothetical protein ACD_73C00262G0002 [uncultured bacterium]